jgi:hypothetical protein
VAIATVRERKRDLVHHLSEVQSMGTSIARLTILVVCIASVLAAAVPAGAGAALLQRPGESRLRY